MQDTANHDAGKIGLSDQRYGDLATVGKSDFEGNSASSRHNKPAIVDSNFAPGAATW